MIKSKGILTISIISLFAVESAYASIASSGYVDQQVETRISEVVEAGTGNVVSAISTEDTKVTATKGIMAEETKNKVNTIRTDGTATDTAYPSEKAVATALDAKQDKLEGEVLTNTATGDLSLSVADAIPTNARGSVVIGNGSSATDAAEFSSVFGIMASSSTSSGVAIGAQSETAGYASIAVGTEASSSGAGSIAIGAGGSAAGALSVALAGIAGADYAIQLGYGENSEANTLSVGLSASNNYKLLGSDGKIPAERLPFTGDVLTNTATANEALSVAGATPANSTGSVVIGNGSSAADSAEYSSVFGSMASSSGPGGVAVGVGSQATGNYATALGNGASAAAESSIAVGTEASASTESSIAVGNGAEATGVGGVAVGIDSKAVGASSTALGPGASSRGIGSVAIGPGASATGNLSVALAGIAGADYAIQLGAGTNSEPNTLSVALSDANNYKLLGSDGKIPAERLPFTGDVLTNTATGELSLSVAGATPANSTGSVVIGNGSSAADSAEYSSVFGSMASSSGPGGVAVGVGSQATGNYATAVGAGASAAAESSIAVGFEASAAVERSVVIGSGSSAASSANLSSVFGDSASSSGMLGVAIGAESETAGYGSTAVGAVASSSGPYSTTLGYAASSTKNFSVALGVSANSQADYAIQLGAGINSEANTLSVGLGDSNNYKLLGSDGKIPAERLPFTGDVLTNTATGSGSFSTGDANVASADRAVAIGSAANAGISSIALGQAADASASSGVAIGRASTAGGGATAVGTASQATAEYSVAIGLGSAASATRAIQIGQGTNSEANTLSVGFGSGANNYKLLGSDGKIPAERLPVATSSTLGGVKSGGDISISSTGAVSVVSALKAVQDANGANIAATYATKNSLNDLNNSKVQKDWTTSNINKVLVIGSDDNYPDVLGKVTVARITENFLSDTIQTKLSNAVTSVATSGSGAVVTGFSKSGNSMTVTKSNVKIPVGSATATTYATIWVE